MTTPAALPTQTTYHQQRLGGRVVRRAILDGGTAMWFEISVVRNWRQVNPTYQGCVQMAGDRWNAVDVDGRTIVGTFTDYADAELFLVRRKTRTPSRMKWTGPRPLKPYVPTCDNCGWELVNGRCTHLHLHWAPAA